MSENKYVQLSYCYRTAGEMGVRGHANQQMIKLGYNVIAGVPQSMGDCYWYTVEKLIEPLPEYLRVIEYDFEHWHGKL